jgi:hypothetical protein
LHNGLIDAVAVCGPRNTVLDKLKLVAVHGRDVNCGRPRDEKPRVAVLARWDMPATPKASAKSVQHGAGGALCKATGGAVLLTNKNGKPLDRAKPEVLAEGVNSKSIAARLTRQRWGETRGGFNRKLVYQPLGLA